MLDAGSVTDKACSAAANEISASHRLLVMQQGSIVVAVPIMLSGTSATVQQAKAAIVEDVQQLMVMVQCRHDVVPTNKPG